MAEKINMAVKVFIFALTGSVCATIFAENSPSSRKASVQQDVTLRAWGVPAFSSAASEIATLRVLEEFQKKFSHITPVTSRGLTLTDGNRTADMIPLMQMAGDIAPDVLYVVFRLSDTYVRNKFLYPLDKYIEGSLDLDIVNGPNMELDDYLAALRKSDRYDVEIGGQIPRVPLQCWEVIRRECPYSAQCHFARANGGDWNFEPTANHLHVWAFPQGSGITVLYYRRDLFAEAGLPDRTPETHEEFIEFARKLTDPDEERYGVKFQLGEQLSWSTLGFLYSTGGRLVSRDENGQWRCSFDSPEAVEAYFFLSRLFHEPFQGPGGKTISSVVYMGESRSGKKFELETAMYFQGLWQTVFTDKIPQPDLIGFGQVPMGPNGQRGNEFNSAMTGIYGGLEGEQHKARRNAAWEYIRYYDSPEARRLRTEVYVEHGMGRFVQPELLQACGYDDYVRQVPKGWSEKYKQALADGVPEPYGKNCQNVYAYASKGISQIQASEEIRQAIIARKQALDAGDTERAEAEEAQAKSRIAEILKVQVRISNEKMLNIIDPAVRDKRNRVAGVVVIVVVVLFVLLFRKVFKVFDAAQLDNPGEPKGKWQFGRYKWAYLLLFVPVGSVILWQYYPLAKGSVMAFQEYNVRGFSEYVGMANFAEVLYDREFWYSVWVTLKYTVLFALFGFTAPIVLAILLTEIPHGKIFFRTVYYLPAVLTGLIVIYLWKSFYGPFGMINEVVNAIIQMLNFLPGVEFELWEMNWLQDPELALVCILLPVVWAGMGPGCLIYLAALKTVPEESYEAADIDGAGIWHKIVHVTLPAIKALIIINFIGVMVATMQGGGDFALAMTGGGPYTPYGETEFVGLKIFFQAFGYLKFGVATAMAWILGSMLIGFTVIQLQRLSRMEFKTVTGTK